MSDTKRDRIPDGTTASANGGSWLISSPQSFWIVLGATSLILPYSRVIDCPATLQRKELADHGGKVNACRFPAKTGRSGCRELPRRVIGNPRTVAWDGQPPTCFRPPSCGQ